VSHWAAGVKMCQTNTPAAFVPCVRSLRPFLLCSFFVPSFFVPSSLPSFLRSFLPSFLRSFLPSFVGSV
jgi:hypothetical protein